MIATLALLALCISRPVAAQDFSPDELMAGRARVYEIEYNVATANANQSDLCGLPRPGSVVDASTVHRRWLSGFMFNLPTPAKPVEPSVYRVWPGSAAERYGLQAGDRITHANGVHLGYGRMGDDNYRRLAGDGAVITIARGNETLVAVVRKQPVCGPPVQFLDGADWVAATNGGFVFISAGAAAAMTDDELAAVIGHEYAHVALRHIEKKQNRALLGALIGAAVGSAVEAETGANVAGDFAQLGAALGAITYSKKMERRADCLGVYYAARAGYDASAAPTLWERIAGTTRDHQRRGDTHPSPVERAFRTRLAADDVVLQLAGGARPHDIQVGACDEPKLKKNERLELYAEHRARSAAKIAAHVRSQTLAATPGVNVARGTPTSFSDRNGFGVVMAAPAAPTVPVGPQWENIEIKTISELAETLSDDPDGQQRMPTRGGARALSNPPSPRERAEELSPNKPAVTGLEAHSTINQDAFEKVRRNFRQANGRWPNAEEEAEILEQIQQRAVSELQIEDKLEELRREWRVRNGAWPSEAETETLRELARSLVDSRSAGSG